EDIHLTSHFEGEAEANGNKLSVQLLGFIAVLILVIAWINYINLSTARAVDRLREVGVRKANGASKINLINQFLLESFLVNLFSLILAYTIIQLTLPWYSQMVGVGVDALMASKYLVWVILLTLLVLGTLGAGAYPAFIMSSYKPALSLKSSAAGFKVQGLTLRKALVIFQFMATVALIAGSLVIFKQISFMQNQKLGVDIDQTLIISAPSSLVGEENFQTSVEIFKERSLRIAGISKASSSNFVPGMSVWGWGGYIRPVETDRDAAKAYNPFQVDHDFLDYYQLDLIAGRNFSRDRILDSTVVILTETSLKKLGYNSPEEAIGHEIYFPIKFNQNDIPREIIGVVRDYHQVSLHDSYLPIIFELNPNESRFFSLKVDGRELDKTISGINTVFTEVFGELPFDYFFLDEDFNNQYQQDKKFGMVLGIFTMFSVIIASMGLFGLASFSATRRTKEVGIRKVLGATAYSVFRLFSIEYIVLVLVASAIALPLTYFGSQLWLKEFAFSIDLGWWFFVIPLVTGFFLAIFSVLYQILKSLNSNPVDLLRYE
ncbi:MAG: FtsX-like permease family protein, partial [Bacteroidetes bacterium]|nr:FtsX-like permease family protein [Bacteroidota bacterium]